MGCPCSQPKRIQNQVESIAQPVIQIANSVGQNKDTQIIPEGFISIMQRHNQTIVDSAKKSKDSKADLMNSFQFFQFNSKHLWQITINKQCTQENIDLILELIEGLLSVLPIYIKGDMTYTLYISKIVAAYAKIVFQFYVTNGKRYLKIDTQSQYLNLITAIEQELLIERENHQLLNNVEYELFQIKAAFTLAPTDSEEGKKILTQFLGGALQAAMTFTLNSDLIESLQKAAIYLYNQYKKDQIKRKFELIYYITGLIYEIIQQIEDNSDFEAIIKKLTQFYLTIIKDCVDWEIKCCWIKGISEIINHKIKIELKSQDLTDKLFEECIKKNYILKIQSEYYVNVNNSKISDDVDANMSYQQIKQLQLHSYIQYVLVQGNLELQGFEDFYKIKIKLQSTETNTLIDKSILINIINQIEKQRELHKKIKEEIKNQQNNNYLEALITEQLEEILLLRQDLHQLTFIKAQLSTIMTQQDPSKGCSAENQISNKQNDDFIKGSHQISMINYLIDILRTNYQNIQNEDIQNQLSDFGISKEYQKSQNQNNKNIISKLEQQLKSITSRMMNTEPMKVKIFNMFSVIDLYEEKILHHNIEYLLKIQLQHDQVEAIEYCDYRGLEAIINQLYQIMQKIQSDKTFNTEGIKYPSKVQIQLINQWISLRHTNVKLIKLSQFKSKGKVAQVMLKIQESGGEIIKKLIAGVERVQKIIEDSQIIKDSDDSSNLNQIFELLDKQTLDKYNQQKVEKIKLEAIKFKLYFQSIKVEQKQDSHLKQIFEELQDINNSLTIISNFIIITSNNEKFFLLLLRDLKILLQTYFDKQNKQFNLFEYEKEIVLFKKISEIAKRLTATQQEDRLIINNIQKFSDSINQHHLNIMNLQICGNKYIIYIEEIENEIKLQIEQESKKLYNLKSELEDLQQLEQLINSHSFQAYPKELESQILFILKSIQNSNASTKLNQFDQFAVTIEDYFNKSQWRTRQCIIFDLQQMQSNLLEPQVMAVNQTLLLKLEIYETDGRVKSLFQNPEHIKQQSQLMEQYWPTIEEQVQKTIKEKLDQLNSIAYQIQSEKHDQAKQRLQKKYKALQQEINEELQNVSKVESSLGITVLFLQDMKQDLIRIQDTLHQMQQAINELGQDVKALRGKSFWDLLELRMKNVFLQMHTALAETIYIPIKTREKLIGNDKQDEQDKEDIEDIEDIEDKLDKEKNVTNLFTDDFFGDGEINEFIWKQNRDTMLIHGLAGSGKSTSSRKIEEFIWRVYEKSQTESGIIPIVPLFIQLPTLKEPDLYAVEETLKSDAYRFNNKQMNEMKESVNQGRLRLVLIFDSFDELKNPFIKKNLYQTNKLEKWRKQGDTYYPKVITTSRTELFTSKDEGYRKLFISTKEDNYKEIRLIKFNKTQIQQYIEEFVSLSKKLTVKEFSIFQDPIEFEKQWKRDISSEQDLNLRLENFVQKEKLSQTQQSLKLLWSVEKYKSTMEQQDIKNFLETPFMIEIVMQVLPKFDEKLKKKQENEELFTIYNFYSFFLDSYIDKQIYKVQQTESFINNKQELIDFAERLAIEMTIRNLSQVEYTSNGLVFKKEISDWRDQFFDDDSITGKYKRLFRQCLPIRQKLGNFSFNHKSLQEFLVGKWLIENIDKIEEEKYYSEINWNDINVEWIQEIVKFIESNRQKQNKIQDSLIKIIQQTSKNEQLIIAGSNSLYILKLLDFDFSNKEWSGMKISNANLKGINFKHCILENCIFDNVNLDNVNLGQTRLINCKLQNVKFHQIDIFQSINFSIDKIDLNFIQFKTIFLFNRLQGILMKFSNFENEHVKQVYQALDYIYFQDLKFYLCEDGLSIDDQVYSDEFLQGNQSTQFLFIGIRYNQYNQNKSDREQNMLIFFFIVNGKSLLELSISQHLERCGEIRYYTYNLTTRILIERTTELIACGRNCLLATHPGSLISLYNMKLDQIIIQNKQINQGNIVSIAVNDEDQYIIGGSDCSLKLYQKDQELNIFFGHIGVVTQLQFIENKYFLSASQEDHSIRFWCIEYQQSLWIFVTSIKISSFAVDLEYKLLFIGSVQGILQRKDFDFQDLIKCEYKYHKAGILCCVVNIYNLLATGSKDNVIKVWDIYNEGQIGKDMIHGTPLCLQFYKKEILYSGEQQGFIIEWSLDSYTLIRAYDNYGDSVTHLLFVQQGLYFRSTESVLKCFDSDQLLFCKEKGSNQTNKFDIKKHLENYQKAKDLPTFQEILDNSQTTQITSIIHSIKSQYCAYGMANGNLIIQHKYGKRLEQQVFEESKIIKLIELEETCLICISEQGFKILKINEESIQNLISCNLENGCNSAILQKDLIKNNQIQETLIIVDDQEITLRNLETGMNDNEIRKIKLNSNTQIITLTVQQRSNEILYCGTQQGRIQIWDIKKEQLIDEISISKLPITQLIYLEQANQLIASSEDGNVYFIQNNQIQEKQLQSKKPIRYMEVSEDERFVILAHSSDLTLWHIFENNTEMIDCFGDFKDISALSVNFAHQYVLIGDVNTLYKIPLSLRRIQKSLSKEFNHYPTCLSNDSKISGDNFGRICFWNSELILLKTYVPFENQRINEIQTHQRAYIIIKYENRIVIADYENGQCLYELLIQSEFVSYCNFPYIFYGMDQSLNYFEFNLQKPKESKSLQLTKTFDIFDRILAIKGDSFLIIYSEKRNTIQKFKIKIKQSFLLENKNDQEFKVLGLKMKDSVIQDKFGNDMTKLFQSCGAINLSEQKSIEQQQTNDP